MSMSSAACEHCGASFAQRVRLAGSRQKTSRWCSHKCHNLSRQRQNDVCGHLEREHRGRGKCGPCLLKERRDRDPEKHRVNARAYYEAHREHLQAAARNYWKRRLEDPRRKNAHTARLRQRKYGPGAAEHFAQKYAEQGGRCAICALPFDEARLCFDHDHATNVWRGLLCRSCNRLEGWLKNTPPGFLDSYIAYVARWSSDRELERAS